MVTGAVPAISGRNILRILKSNYTNVDLVPEIRVSFCVLLFVT